MQVDPAGATQAVRQDSLAAIVGAPEYALPWLDRFYDESDALLLEALAAGPDGRTRRSRTSTVWMWRRSVAPTGAGS